MRKLQNFYGDTRGKKIERSYDPHPSHDPQMSIKRKIHTQLECWKEKTLFCLAIRNKKIFHSCISSVGDSDKRSFCKNTNILQGPCLRDEYTHTHNKVHFVRLINQGSKLIREIIIFSLCYIKMNSILGPLVSFVR